MTNTYENTLVKKPTETASQFECLVITRRDYFAAAALQGLLANSFSNGITQPLSTANAEEMAILAQTQADCLINALAL